MATHWNIVNDVCCRDWFRRAGVSATIRGGDIIESASVVGLGTGLFFAGIGTAVKFGFFGEAPKKEPVVPRSMDVIGPAILASIGTTIGYIGTKLFIDAAVSTAPFVDASLGFPVTVGLIFCCKHLLNYYDQMQDVQHTNFNDAVAHPLDNVL